jgi:hypothetical protein
MRQSGLKDELRRSGGRLCTMIGTERQSDFDSIGDSHWVQSVALGNSEVNDYDPADEVTGSVPPMGSVERRPSWRTG